jgi:hypothetical protein
MSHPTGRVAWPTASRATATNTPDSRCSRPSRSSWLLDALGSQHREDRASASVDANGGPTLESSKSARPSTGLQAPSAFDGFAQPTAEPEVKQPLQAIGLKRLWFHAEQVQVFEEALLATRLSSTTPPRNHRQNRPPALSGAGVMYHFPPRFDTRCALAG